MSGENTGQLQNFEIENDKLKKEIAELQRENAELRKSVEELTRIGKILVDGAQ